MASEQALLKVTNQLQDVLNRFEVLYQAATHCPRLSSSQTSNVSALNEGEVAPSVKAFEQLAKEHLSVYFEKSKSLGSPIQDQALLMSELLSEHGRIIHLASLSRRSMDQLPKLAEKQLNLISQMVSLAQKNRSSPLFNNLSTISEALGVFGWVSVEPAPVNYVHEVTGASQFYSNKLLREFKDKNLDQVAWVTSINSFLKALESYIKQYHTTGLTWNPKGVDPASLSSTVSSGSSSSSPVTPTPPPAVTGSNEGPKLSELFSAINQGVGVSSGLKKVTSDMKTKNRADRAGLVVTKDPVVTKSTPSTGTRPRLPPKTVLEGNNWIIEHHVDNAVVEVDITEMRQVVRLYKCDQAMIRLKGKLNAINIDSCRKTNIIFDEAVSVVELVNCNGSVNIQVLGKVPSIVIDKSSGVSIILSQESLHTQVITSKSDSINISIPTNDQENPYKEYPVPEQYINRIVNGNLVSECNQHLGE